MVPGLDEVAFISQSEAEGDRHRGLARTSMSDILVEKSEDMQSFLQRSAKMNFRLVPLCENIVSYGTQAILVETAQRTNFAVQ